MTERGDGGERGLPRPRKRFGQHFLRDRGVLARIADALQLTGAETVVEIGPGRGALTDILAERARRLVAVEVDRDLAAHLRARYADRPHVEIVEADVLTVGLAAVAGSDDYVLAGNVPYYITTPILFHALRAPRPRRAVYLVQKEVAERAAAAPGGKEYGALGVNLQALARVELVARVPPGAFQPPPQVDSAVIRVTPRDDPAVTPAEEARYRTVVQEAFGLRRKQLRRVVRTIARLDAERAEAVLAAAGLDPEARPETLSPGDFARLVRALPGAAAAD
ncbi:16S rRNA (adenine(1518)-N(6)/adenine(1519)-N(6))-dimethyltransferase RsmA [Roseisolibacter sp. H3M3-2]|uniref:16S rRNA (adenine(1518)-N(6)/adenine(1519)-N(6))- dimethyltransferase RsmA n=1 Tax=Roseisolibacter sp. H3M3-2 TaxID=3031323 RepID=UPI0023DBBB86|nr:16S rRNA (adenine(1518)-N(6)/adenine(1519)-N(6))-dimethyltransferase RsmA [Roseisolibacter sp. H3M3-2]MDF1502186.1 16S rRNA (adenine(1518)-N(6)/adenine(1519)-N(6))-dimethyltransferase RsmA [Roseisolibacter sp. H3M3-2]